MISRRTEWEEGEEEMGYPPRSRKLGIPDMVRKGGEGRGRSFEEVLIMKVIMYRNAFKDVMFVYLNDS